MLTSVIDINLGQPARVLALVKKHFPSLKGVSVAVLGLAFKPDTDDIRESPAFPIIDLLLEEGATICTYDPVAMDNAKRYLGDREVEYVSSTQAAVSKADVVILVTSWPEFGDLAELLSARPRQPLVVDGRRFLDKSKFKKYSGIGV